VVSVLEGSTVVDFFGVLAAAGVTERNATELARMGVAFNTIVDPTINGGNATLVAVGTFMGSTILGASLEGTTIAGSTKPGNWFDSIYIRNRVQAEIEFYSRGLDALTFGIAPAEAAEAARLRREFLLQ
jgi:hypothetical protein